MTEYFVKGNFCRKGETAGVGRVGGPLCDTPHTAGVRRVWRTQCDTPHTAGVGRVWENAVRYSAHCWSWEGRGGHYAILRTLVELGGSGRTQCDTSHTAGVRRVWGDAVRYSAQFFLGLGRQKDTLTHGHEHVHMDKWAHLKQGPALQICVIWVYCNDGKLKQISWNSPQSWGWRSLIFYI